MESALPIGCECERLSECLPNNVAGFVRGEQIRVKRRYLYYQTIVRSFDLRIESFKMIVDSLKCFLHFFCTTAGNRDLNIMFCFHILLILFGQR